MTARVDTSLDGQDVALGQLLGRLGARFVADVAPSGGRHVYVLFAAPLPWLELRDVARALSQRFPAVDPAPMSSLGGQISPPGARHKNGGWRLLSMPLSEARAAVEHPNGPEVWAALLDELAAELRAVGPVPPWNRSDDPDRAAPPGVREAVRGFVLFVILIAVVVAATGPWSHLGSYDFVKPTVSAVSSLSHKTAAVAWEFAPAVGGTWILVSWIVIVAALRVRGNQLAAVFRRTFTQMWGALLVAPIIFGLADAFNYSGMANTLAHGFAQVGTSFILLAPILGWIGVALSGSNTTTNALFGGFQYSVGGLLKMPILLLPSLNSVGAEVGKPVAPQTASVGVSTSKFVRREGEVIRHNMSWTLVMLAYLIVIGLFYRYVAPAAMRL